jgi:asparagine synthase (glutamine-hydrolysing)
MCGIAGIIDFDGRPIDQTVLHRLCDQLGHRGPDDRDTFHTHRGGLSVGLAHTRLAVIDPNPRARQPMLDDGQRWAIVYNGEIYNYREINRELDAGLRTDCDTETALLACRRWQVEALDRLDGMWAMAVLDLERGRGFLARDPFGIKPLYYTVQGSRLVFASEMRALRCVPDLCWELDREAMAIYLNLGWIPHPQTIYRRIHKLAPGHFLSFDSGGIQPPHRFYRMPEPDFAPVSYEEARSQVRQRVEQAVDRQRIADVPLGTFLSGGLDSSIVTACLARSDPRGAIKSFSIGYPEHARYDESSFAREAASYLGTEHHAFSIGFDDVLAAVGPILDHLGEPFADSSLLPTSIVSRMTRGEVTVALSGDGGDELFGGYWRYMGHHYLGHYRLLPKWVRRRLIAPLLERCPEGRSYRWMDRVRQLKKLARGDVGDALDTHLAWARMLDDRGTTRLMSDHPTGPISDPLRARYGAGAADWFKAYKPARGLEEILLADLAIGLPCDMLHKVDLAAMACGLEVRVPLLDRQLVEYVSGLPIEYRISGASGKHILRDAFSDLLPRSVIHRPKMGFEVPIGEFLRNELQPVFRDTVNRSSMSDLGLDHSVVERLYDEHFARRRDHADLLWSLFVLGWWHRGNRAP